jgi:hypothetical protein
MNIKRKTCDIWTCKKTFVSWRSPFGLLKPASEHACARLLPRLSWHWTVLLHSDIRRKPITSSFTSICNLFTDPPSYECQLHHANFIWHIKNCSITLNKKIICTPLVDGRAETLKVCWRIPRTASRMSPWLRMWLQWEVWRLLVTKQCLTYRTEMVKIREENNVTECSRFTHS